MIGAEISSNEHDTTLGSIANLCAVVTIYVTSVKSQIDHPWR